MKKVLVLFGLTLLWANSAFAAETACAKFANSVTQGTDAKKLKTFLDVQWKYFMTESPEWATFVGYPGQDDRWTDMSLSALARRRAETVCQKNALTKIKRAG